MDKTKHTSPVAKYAVGKGWHPLVDEAAEKLNGIGVKVFSHYEKYGTLQFDVEPVSMEAIAVLNEIEDRSQHICEMCGAAGPEVSGDVLHGYVKTLCPACRKIRRQQQDQ